ncbi:MAG: hypothetical protein DI539_15140 [Flavobacterium psychrophilum]|nr:MAG: hypothetical protein DI539_15140 [Flavobacterium psychrophilum]
MKPAPSFKRIAVEVICLLYILLFVYAAVSKLLEFDDFSIQLGQSPLIGAYASILRWLVPISEILIAIGLLIPKFRIWALYCCFLLMCFFTAYIYIILNFSSYIPCSCGGILEKLGWRQHLIFNAFFILLGAVGILQINLSSTTTKDKLKKTALTGAGLLFTLVISALVLMQLYNVSESRLSKSNPFIRKFVPATARKGKLLDLKYNTYYFAGINDKKIYLGNSKAFQRITQIDTALTSIQVHDITFPTTDDKYIYLKLNVGPSDFYYYDGTVPEIIWGSKKDWKIKSFEKTPEFFNNAAIIDSSSIITRNVNPKTGKNYLSRQELQISKAFNSQSVLTTQVDGVFDTDGDMFYEERWKKFIYVYRYRNQYLITNPQLEHLSKGKTIDTNSIAKIKVGTSRQSGFSQLSAPPLVVNKYSTVYKNLLFIQSVNLGRFEPTNMRKESSTIDVYNMKNGKYIASFYVYHEQDKKLRTFAVYEDAFYAMVGTSIIKYNLGKNITSEYVK